MEPDSEVKPPTEPVPSAVFAQEVISLIGHNDIWHQLEMQAEMYLNFSVFNILQPRQSGTIN